jgi:AcrR family transcriptional regulator
VRIQRSHRSDEPIARSIDLSPTLVQHMSSSSSSRYNATAERIFEACLQIVMQDGREKLTLSRVQSASGISMPTISKYFPKRRALVQGLCEWQFSATARAIESVCLAQHGQPLRSMIRALVDACWTARFDRPGKSRVLFQLAGELDDCTLNARLARRVEHAATIMLEAASDASFDNPTLVSLTWVTVLFGMTKGIIERDLPLELLADTHQHVERMCLAYVESAARS